MGVELEARHQVPVPLQHVHTLLRGGAVHLDEVSGHTEEVPATGGKELHALCGEAGSFLSLFLPDSGSRQRL